MRVLLDAHVAGFTEESESMVVWIWFQWSKKRNPWKSAWLRCFIIHS